MKFLVKGIFRSWRFVQLHCFLAHSFIIFGATSRRKSPRADMSVADVLRRAYGYALCVIKLLVISLPILEILFFQVCSTREESVRCCKHILHRVSFDWSKVRFVAFTLIFELVLSITCIFLFLCTPSSYTTLREQLFPLANSIFYISFQTVLRPLHLLSVFRPQSWHLRNLLAYLLVNDRYSFDSFIWYWKLRFCVLNTFIHTFAILNTILLCWFKFTGIFDGSTILFKLFLHIARIFILCLLIYPGSFIPLLRIASFHFVFVSLVTLLSFVSIYRVSWRQILVIERALNIWLWLASERVVLALMKFETGVVIFVLLSCEELESWIEKCTILVFIGS